MLTQKKISHNAYKIHSVCNILDCKGSIQDNEEELVIRTTINKQAKLLLRVQWKLEGNILLLAVGVPANPRLGLWAGHRRLAPPPRPSVYCLRAAQSRFAVGDGLISPGLCPRSVLYMMF